MSIIKQTNRTMLFEEINPQKPDLLTLVGDVRGVDSLSDEKIKEINEALLVKSFDELLPSLSRWYTPFLTPIRKKSCIPWKSRRISRRKCLVPFG